MRNIPQSLKNKLAEKWQVKANNAQPNLRIVATQAAVNTLISETIHENKSTSNSILAVFN